MASTKGSFDIVGVIGRTYTIAIMCYNFDTYVMWVKSRLNLNITTSNYEKKGVGSWLWFMVQL